MNEQTLWDALACGLMCPVVWISVALLLSVFLPESWGDNPIVDYIMRILE